MMNTRAILVAVTLLAGCASETPRPHKINEEILGELNKATQRQQPVQPAAVNTALLPPMRMELPNMPRQQVEPKFDLVVNGAPAREVFMSIVSGTRYSMIVHPEVSGVLSVNLKDVTVREALDSIREVYGYEYKLDGARIYIQPAGMQTRVFQVNYLVGIRSGGSSMNVSGGSTGNTAAGTPVAPAAAGGSTASAPGGGATATGLGSSIITTTRSDFWTDLTVSLRSLIGAGDGRNVIVNPQGGVVVVRAMPAELRAVESYLKALRNSVERQVMLEAKIIDVTLNDANQSGVNWAAFQTGSTRISAGQSGASTTQSVNGALTGRLVTATPGQTLAQVTALGTAATETARLAGASTIGLAFQVQNFAALLEFLESQGSLQVLSSPRVATLNNQKAVLKVGTDQGFVTALTTSDPSQLASGLVIPGRTTVTLSNFFDGVSLDITPQINEDGNILLHIHPLVSRVEGGISTFNASTSGDFSTPKSVVSETDTMVRVLDGNIVALGGLMQIKLETGRSGIPGAQDAPGIGGLFGNRGRASVKKELVILIKPTVIQNDRDWEKDIVDTRNRLQSYGAEAPPQTSDRAK